MKKRLRIACLVLSTSLSVATLNAATYHVSQKASNASDDNPGTGEEPLKTINKAAGLVAAGDSVVIHGGVYRETVTVTAQGTTESPIRFTAAPGERVVVTGADLFTNWTREPSPDTDFVFSTSWDDRLRYHRHLTQPDDDFHAVIGRCEQVIVNNYEYSQVLSREQMSRGTFYVDLEKRRLYLWTRFNGDIVGGKGNKNYAVVEVATRGVIWDSQGEYVHVQGITFKYAGNAAQAMAVNFAGRNELVEDCVFECMNAAGAGFRGENTVIRRCTFQDNGQLGVETGPLGRGLLFSECVFRNNNTKGWNRGWSAGGMKVSSSRNILVEKCMFLKNRGVGLWFDTDCENNEVRNCLMADNEESGIFYEISYGLTAHDNVLTGNGWLAGRSAWGGNGALTLSSSPDSVIERNLMVGNREGFQFREQPRTTPKREGQRRVEYPIWNHDEIIRNNLIAYNGEVQTGAWFAQGDERHWPAAMQTGKDGKAVRIDHDNAAEYLAKDERQPKGLSLEKLNIRMVNNMYAVADGQKLILWGALFSRHAYYDALDKIQSELGLEKGSTVEQLQFAGAGSSLDFRVPASSPALTRNCYPQGTVPGVQLGTMER